MAATYMLYTEFVLNDANGWEQAGKMIPRHNQSANPELFLLGFQLHRTSRIIFFAAVLIVFMMTITGNLLMIIVVSTTQSLRSPMYFLLSHLSFCDIILSMTITPNLLYVTLQDGSPMTVSGCITQLYFFSLSSATECLLLTMMSYDRYVAVCKPLHYVTIMNFPFCLGLVVLSWTLGLSLSMMLNISLCHLQFCNSNTIDHFFCDYAPFFQVSCSDTTIVQTMIFIISTPEIVIETMFIISTYVCIFLAIHRIASTTGRQKAFSTCSSHLTVVCTYYGTLAAIYVFPSGEQSFNMNKIMSLVYTVVTPLLNPLIYSLRNREIKAALKNYLEKKHVEV
ncbi:olfactory receptor 5G9-like [Pelobates fuscus]|uniref:olfactory receptor 5G9-like n=1 Tax=Pelobates fuscus TaxID=191477 RepID=UPI002FE451C7